MDFNSLQSWNDKQFFQINDHRVMRAMLCFVCVYNTAGVYIYIPDEYDCNIRTKTHTESPHKTMPETHKVQYITFMYHICKSQPFVKISFIKFQIINHQYKFAESIMKMKDRSFHF